MNTSGNVNNSGLKKIIAIAVNILSDRKSTIAIILLVIMSRAIQLVYYYNIYVDASYQVIGTQSLLDGYGVSTPDVLYHNLSETIYTPLINWPPGYSLLFAPFFRLFNYNYIAAGITIDILFAITLIFVCRRILKLLDIPLHLRNLFTLLTGFFIYSFYFYQCSDAIAITFLLLAFYFTISIIKTSEKIVIKTSWLILFLCLTAFMKYLFMPVVFVLPVFLLVKGIQDQNSQIKKAGIYSLLSLAFFVGLLLLYQKLVGGSATYISSPNRGFYPENLLKTYPAIPASFIKPDTFSIMPLGGTEMIFSLYQVVYILFLVVVTVLMSRQVLKQGFKRLTITQSFFYISYLLSFAIIILLTALSLRVEQEQIFTWYLWTYVEDSRYYGLLNVLIHLGVFVLYRYAVSNYKVMLKYFCIALLILMIPEMMRGLYFDTNRIKKFGKEEYSWQYENRFQQYAHAIIKKERNQNSSNKIVITGTSYNMNNRVSINSHVVPLSDVSKINNFSLLNTKSPVVLLAMLQKDSLASYQPFITKEEVQLTGSFDGFNFYTVYVKPH
jgi:hypothetical protein